MVTKRQPKSAATRRAIELYRAGATVTAAAREAGCHTVTVSRAVRQLIAQGDKSLNAIAPRGRPRTGDKCEWTQDDDGVWDTECGERYEVTDGSPGENDMKYCPYCGKVLCEQSLI